MKNKDSQLSIGGLLFIIAGIAICFGIVPRLPPIGPNSSSLTPFFAVVLMFGWAMIAVRRGSRRAWWIGFVISGILYLSAVTRFGGPAIYRVAETSRSVSYNPRVAPVVSGDMIEACLAIGVLLFLVALLFGAGAFGGFCARALLERWRLCDT